MNPLALYVHFPYCLYKCHYCDFNSYAVEFTEDLEIFYRTALLGEIKKIFENLPSSQITSLFFGGGTPSLFSAQSFEKIFETLSSLVSLKSDGEITIEMNPKTIGAEKIRDYLRVGINRFSLGVQSFEDRYLSPLGRLHTGEEAKTALRMIKKGGVQNFNLDLMFGFPSQRPDEVLNDLRQALEFEPSHLSFYNLTLEDGTLLKDQFLKGKIRLPDNEVQARMYEEGIGYLEGKGYRGYEISNFCRPGKESRHNLAYWRYENYLGLGAGAVSFLKKECFGAKQPQDPNENLYGYRWTNPKIPKEYRSHMTDRTYSFSNLEKIDQKTAAGEFWMMGLRLSEGVCLNNFERHFGRERKFYYEESVIPCFQKKGWIARDRDQVRLTPAGRMFGNEVVSGFLLE